MTDKKRNEDLQHTRGGSTTRDATDMGVTMRAAEDPKKETVGPEDALAANTRGDYSGRLGGGESYVSRVVGYRDDGSPIIELVRQK